VPDQQGAAIQQQAADHEPADQEPEGSRYRTEHDSMGDVRVPADALWGAQTQRAVENFPISGEPLHRDLIVSLASIKGVAAMVNAELGVLDQELAAAIHDAAAQIAAGEYLSQFPLDVFQTGSGTSSNMNANEVIATLASRRLGRPVHPNDHVNASQSSNDVFPSAIHLAACYLLARSLEPALARLAGALEVKAAEFADVVKAGRTHLMDATPVTLGQEFGGYAAAIRHGIRRIRVILPEVGELPLGGTAVGTGLNAPAGFGEQVATQIAAMTGTPFVTAANKFTAQATLDRMVRAHGGLRAAAVTLFKIANDLRWLGSGPRTGLGELLFPENEPGSSIMPGKVNPTQAEAMLMVAIEVIASDVAVSMAGAEGNFELNAFRPIVIANYLHSALIMADMCEHFRSFMVEGTRLNEAKLKDNIDRSVMMVTALSPVIGYDTAAKISYYAIDHDQTLKQAALANGVSEDLYDRVVDPLALTRGGSADLPQTGGSTAQPPKQA
jgi:fumarate hydratase, class II